MKRKKGGLTMAGEGQMLRAAREERKWSLTETEDTTKISVRYIQALEEEEYKVIPGITYVKGYLRTYAKQLGLNPDEIISLYNSSSTPVAEPIIERPQIMRKSRPVWIRPAIIGAMAILAMGLVIAIASLTNNGKKTADTQFPTALPSAPKTVETTPSPSVPVQQITSPSPEVASQEGLIAQLVFSQRCWIEVRVDGQPSLRGEFPAGTSKEVKGTNKIELVSVGNAGGLSVTLNGKELPSLGKPWEPRYNVVLTKDNLNQL
jgi:cytoskeleton protein RodZ